MKVNHYRWLSNSRSPFCSQPKCLELLFCEAICGLTVIQTLGVNMAEPWPGHCANGQSGAVDATNATRPPVQGQWTWLPSPAANTWSPPPGYGMSELEQSSPQPSELMGQQTDLGLSGDSAAAK